MPLVTVDRIYDAPASVVWDAVTDWAGQSEWVLATTVTVKSDDGLAIGTEIEAVTGVGPFVVRDPMVVTEWDPPRRCVVRHLGAVVRGRGIVEVSALSRGRSRLVWAEDLEVPFGVLGRLGWVLARGPAVWGIRRSLDRLARRVEPA